MSKQLILLEYNNCEPFIYEIVSDGEITIDKVANHFAESEEWNEEKDSITFVDEVTQIKI